VIRNPAITVDLPVWNKEIFYAGLRTQNCDKGLDRFIGKFDPSVPISAVIVIEPGCHFDHGTAIYFRQGKRRCLLLDTPYGLTDDEDLWYTLLSWAKFQPQAEMNQASCTFLRSTPTFSRSIEITSITL
jgi:hypothetical protein